VRAALYHGVRDVRIEEVPEPEPGPGQVEVRVAHNGVCGSDLHEYFSATRSIPREPHPLTGARIPVVLGHEFSGTVVALGDGVSGVAVGDRAAIRPNYSCGECPACRLGHPNACRLLAFHGLSGPGGGLSEFTVVDRAAVHVLPDGVSLELGALVEPMAVSYHAAVRSGVQPGQTALIAGLGPIGIGLFQALRAMGISSVVASDPSPERRAALVALGAEHVVDPTDTDLVALCAELSDGIGATAGFDAAGVGAAISGTLPALAPRGRLVLVGIHEQPTGFDPMSLLFSEKEVLGSAIYTAEDYDWVIAAMAAGRYSVDSWVEHAGLDDLLAVFDALRAGSRTKVLIDL
jgi:(R,R)-butanediol dehydrogenase/meso-butanediol dehydrogenase/diacetyl reductase